MTPRNPLDDKVIVDREFLERHYRTMLPLVAPINREKWLGPLRDALGADLNGWAAVVTVSTTKMDSAGYETACKFGYETSGHFEEIFDAMLAACPPLPTGKE